MRLKAKLSCSCLQIIQIIWKEIKEDTGGENATYLMMQLLTNTHLFGN